MAKLIKSHSNYVLRTKHQNTSNGTIFERDITTIGGRDSFSKGQVPIYKSGNFVITINDDANNYKKVAQSDWHRSDAGDIWTLDVLKYFEKDEKSSDDRKIEIKKDYHDLRDYAYFGSCSELIRTSINNIINTFPGELFIPNETLYVSGDEVQYTKDAAEAAFDSYEEKVVGLHDYYSSMQTSSSYNTTDSCGNDISIASVNSLDPPTQEEIDGVKNGIPYQREYRFLTDLNGNKLSEKELALIDNPFGINIHEKYVPEGENPLKYFAEGGIDNYVGYIQEKNEETGELEWHIDEEHEYTITIEDIIYDGLGESDNLTETFKISDDDLCDDAPNCETNFTINLEANSNDNRTFGCTVNCVEVGKYLGKIKLCFRKRQFTFKTDPGLQRDEETGEVKVLCCGDTLGVSAEGGDSGVNVESYSEEACEETLTIYMFMGENDQVKYFVEDNEENFKFRIRPNTEVIDDYFYNLDSFEKLLLNRDSSPIYTADLELIGESDFGHYTYTRQFTFPTTYGGYNLGSTTQSFSTYLTELVKVGKFYDELFTDNIWRSMTHESIKNFDWTFTRQYNKNDEIPFVEGGTKIQKMLRIYGREFDEIKSYIDAIDNLNTVTYDNVNNLPDYFLTDDLEENGWDVKLIHPLILSEFVNNHDSVPIDIDTLFSKKYDEDGKEINTAEAEKLNYFYDSADEETRNKIKIQRVFNQDFSEMTVKPYSCSNIIESECSFKERKNCDGNEIKLYCDENEYNSTDVNNEFLRRLAINSNAIWKHKGTIDGIEMLLSLFGLKSKRSIYSNEKYFTIRQGGSDADEQNIFGVTGGKSKEFDCGEDEFSVSVTAEKSSCLAPTGEGKCYYKNYLEKMYDLYDYDIKEYTMFTTRQEDEWLDKKNMFTLDWVNSTKLITYDTEDFRNGNYIPYQGLPVSYREVELEKEPDENEETTDAETNEEKETEMVRYIYPHFNSYERYDGNPYYQMKGGWMQKKPFMFDVNNNIIPDDYEKPKITYGDETNSESDTSEDEEGEAKKKTSLFTETVKNIKCVQNLQELLSNPSLANDSGDICQVTDITGRYAIIDGAAYPLISENNDGNSDSGVSFFYVTVENNSLSVGNAYFTDYVIISNPYFANEKQRIDLTDDYYNDREIKIYVLKKEKESENDETSSDEEPEYYYDIDVYSNDSSISTFTVFEDGKYMDGDNYTNYFRINNIDYYSELSILGWQQLKDDEYEYLRINALTDYREGNNPHTGHMMYDNGHEYLTYFQKLFKHTIDNNLIDYRQYTTDEIDLTTLMDEFGFTNLIDKDICNKDYDAYLREDSKCHYFGEILSKVDGECNDSREGLTCFPTRELSSSDNYEKNEDGDCVRKEDKAYTIKSIYRKAYIDDSDGQQKVVPLQYGEVYNEMLGEEGEYDEDKIDEITDQIVNTKRMEIEFYIRNTNEYSKEWLEEVKYIDSVILPYLSQVIPSTVIWRVKYTTINGTEDWKTETDC